ncbi:MAG TPA: hypothetical protein VEY71_04700 [Chitinophagales bacterium]|nr:hypothetical protein [Chitinophagales bacterium]
MDITTKRNLGDRVFFMHDNRAHEAEITRILVSAFSDVFTDGVELSEMYTVSVGYDVMSVMDRDCFDSADALREHLFKSFTQTVGA